MIRKSCLVLALAAPGAVSAGEARIVPFDGTFDDASFAVESAIVGQGLVIDHVSRVGDMLKRTGADVGSDITLFEAADVYVFCSAVVSREVMEADPMNIAYCPYGVFVADTGSGVIVGRQDYPDGAMDRVEVLLDTIIDEAVDG